MGFLVITCIRRTKKFLGIIPLRIAMIIMGIFLGACAAYAYFEAKIFFVNTKAFGLINKEAFSLIEGVIGLLLIFAYCVPNILYALFLYLLTFALTGAALAYNVFKISIFNDKIKEYEVKHHLIQFMFLIRIGAEFLIQITVCYIAYSYKKEIEHKK